MYCNERVRLVGSGHTAPHDGSTLDAIGSIEGQVAVNVGQQSIVVAVVGLEAKLLEQLRAGGVLQAVHEHIYVSSACDQSIDRIVSGA